MCLVYAPIDKRLSRRPFTPESGVQIPLGVPQVGKLEENMRLAMTVVVVAGMYGNRSQQNEILSTYFTESINQASRIH